MNRSEEETASDPFSSVGDQKLNNDLQSNRRREKPKMIYRKWSLLTGPVAILGGVVATVVVANFIFVKEDPFLKPKERKPVPSSK